MVICRNPVEGFVVEQFRRNLALHVRIGILQHARGASSSGFDPSYNQPTIRQLPVSNASTGHLRWRANAVIKAVESLTLADSDALRTQTLTSPPLLGDPKKPASLVSFLGSPNFSKNKILMQK